MYPWQFIFSNKDDLIQATSVLMYFYKKCTLKNTEPILLVHCLHIRYCHLITKGQQALYATSILCSKKNYQLKDSRFPNGEPSIFSLLIILLHKL